MPIHRGPGREREPDAIERMVVAAWMRDGSTLPIPHDLLDDAIADMLAAVRELRNIAANSGPALADEYLDIVIQGHERRAGGKGE